MGAVNVSPTLGALYQPIEEPLQGVRAAVDQVWRDALTLVHLENADIPHAGGKMLRPALCLMAAGALGARDLERYVPMGAAFECLHIASLAHDDVIDRALLRRGNSSLTGLWDNHAAVLGGDYLVARAVETLATYDSCSVIANAIRSVRCMAEGELYFFGRDPEAVTREDCIMLAEQKTASLFAEACAGPSFVLDATHRNALHAFGIGLGVAFQIVDDTLDVTRTSQALGKPACGDVVEGKQTLPIMYLRDGLDSAGRARLAAMRNAELSDEDRGWIIKQAQRTGAGQRALDDARAFVDDAIAALRQLPESPYTQSMEGVAEFVLVRGH